MPFSSHSSASVLAAAVAACVGLTAGAAAGQVPGSGGGAVPGSGILPAVVVDTFTLSNGLHVVVAEDHSAPLVAVNLTYRVGSAHEPAGRHGFAHLFEHLFEGETTHLERGEAARLVADAGGLREARTGTDRTVLAEVVPVNHLERVLWLHAERMGGLTLTDVDFEIARDRVLAEFRSGVTGQAYGAARLAVETLDSAWEPYGHPVIGSPADLETATPADAREFYRRMYGPVNATLVVAGDVSPGQVRSLALRHLGGIQAGDSVPPLPDPPEVPRRGRGEDQLLPDTLARQPLVYLGFDIPPAGHPDEAAIRVLFELLAGESGRLRRRLVETDGTALAVTGSVQPRLGPSRMIFGAVASRGGSPLPVSRAMEEEFQRLAVDGPTPGEVVGARNRLIRMEMERWSEVAGRADRLQEALLLRGAAAGVSAFLSSLERVTAEDVREVAGRYLTEGNRTRVVAAPNSSAGRRDP